MLIFKNGNIQKENRLTNDLTRLPNMYIGTEANQQAAWHDPRINSETLTPLLSIIPFAKNVNPYKTMFFAKLLKAKM